jgi:DNA polymerase I
MDLVFDIETDDLKATKIHCLVAQDANSGEIFKFPPSNLQEGYELLSKSDRLIGHNIIGFDIPMVEKFGGIKLRDKEVIDTLVLSRLFNPTREGGHSLEKWGYKLGLAKINFEDYLNYSTEMLDYCVRDVQLNTLVYKSLRNESKGFSKQSIELEQDVARIIKQQEENGFMSKRGLTDDEYQRCLDTNNFETFMRQTLQEFNLGSRKQIGEYLVDFGWKPERFTPTGQPIVDEKTLSEVTHIREAKLIADFLLIQKRIAQVDSWVEAVQEDGRVHGFVIPNGAITGRMTHRSPNMAQVPSVHSPYGTECRACWIVDEGNVLLGVDASGLELRMLAHYMNDDEYIKEILNGDIHTANQRAAKLESRDKAKTFIYALMYGAGDEKLGSVVGGSTADGKRARQYFFDNKPTFKSLRDRVQRAASKKYLKGLDGRKLYIRNAHSALNTLLQGAGAIVMKKALSILDDVLKLNAVPYKFVANIHDEWQLEVPKDKADFIGQFAVDSITKAGEHFNLRCPLDGEYKIGGNWSETH